MTSEGPQLTEVRLYNASLLLPHAELAENEEMVDAVTAENEEMLENAAVEETPKTKGKKRDPNVARCWWGL